MIRLLTLPAGFILDLLMGDPRWLYHPVCLIGNLISILEKGIRRVFPKTDKGERAGGILEVVLVCFITFFIPYVVIHLFYKWNFWLGFALETFWCGQLLATKSLKVESMKVYDRLKNGTIEEARYAVSMIVGRDTQALSEIGVTKAAVETVAENSSDGIIAPMFYMAIGGIPLMFLYKGINTMDSMLGYKNDKYLYFGRCAARLDDVANYIPARISGWLMALSTVFVGMDTKNAVKIYRRDRRNHASPILPRQKRLWQEHWMFSWQEMLIILVSYMKNRRSGIRSARLKSRIFQERISCFMQPVLWEQFYSSG